MPELTLEDVAKTVNDLRAEVKKSSEWLGGIDHDKIERMQKVLDEAETKIFQPINTLQLEEKKHVAEVKELKEELEKKGVEAGKIREQVDALELELARTSRTGSPDPNEYKQMPEYKALNKFCLEGLYQLDQEQKALLRTDSFVEGGVLVTTEMDTVITKKITEIDPIRAVSRVRSINSKSIELPIRSTIPTATYEGETEEGSDSVSTYQSSTITPFRQTFTVPITRDMLMDAAFDMESEIMSDASEAFAFGEGNGFVLGSGFKQPLGFLSVASLQAAARLSGVSGQLTPESLILLTGDLKAGYDPVYVLNRRTLATIRTFRADAVSAGDASGGFLWMPGLGGAVASTINGYRYILANSMPDIASNAYAVAFGDFRRAYTIIDRTGLSVVRDEFTQKKKAIIEFTLNRWNTGQLTLEEPVKLLKITA